MIGGSVTSWQQQHLDLIYPHPDVHHDGVRLPPICAHKRSWYWHPHRESSVSPRLQFLVRDLVEDILKCECVVGCVVTTLCSFYTPHPREIPGIGEQ
jgi:hypothetical protein